MNDAADQTTAPFPPLPNEPVGQTVLRLLTERPLLSREEVCRALPYIHAGGLADTLKAFAASGNLRLFDGRYATDRGILLLAALSGAMIGQEVRELQAQLPPVNGEAIPGSTGIASPAPAALPAPATPSHAALQRAAAQAGATLERHLQETLALHTRYFLVRHAADQKTSGR